MSAPVLAPDRFPDFYTNVLAACGLHDIGKATDSFQNAVEHHRPQLIRHEHMSALVLSLPQVRSWLNAELDADLVISAVAGHHLKASVREESHYPAFAEKWSGHNFADSIDFFGDHPNLQAVFQNTADRLALQQPEFHIPGLWSFSGDGEASIPDVAGKLIKRFQQVRRRLRDKNTHGMFMAVKTALIAADSAGSGLVREQHEIEEWLHPLFSDEYLLRPEDIEDKVLSKRRKQIEEREQITNPSFEFVYQDFQNEAANLPHRTLMLAPCGTGKTLAAWRWIEAQLASSPRSRVLFLYPTRATATEGFRDYVSHAPETDASLLTGTARYELRDLFENPEDGKAYLTEERLFALGYWRKRVFSATVDQFLGFMQQTYRGLCLLPVLVDSIVVFDEVHSYDIGMFDALKKFLDRFEVPALCMTASLPTPRRRQLEGLGLHLFKGEGLGDLEQLADLPRYEVARLESADEAKSIARQAMAEDKRVLWVVNTVDRCQELAKELSALEPICYHSRFTLDDRKTRHSEVIEAFQPPHAKGRIAITTQVCEMSLDLDTQVLISEYAPIPSLIQRMGRCNRCASVGNNTPGKVYFHPTKGDKPYYPDELLHVPAFVADIAGGQASQALLEERLAHYTKQGGSEADRWAAFIDDGPWSRGGVEELRDSPEYTVQAVIEIDKFLELQEDHQPTDGLILPVPKYLAQTNPRLPRHLRQAPANHYDQMLGFMKRPVDQGVLLV